jgi:hypothetical protein
MSLLPPLAAGIGNLDRNGVLDHCAHWPPRGHDERALCKICRETPATQSSRSKPIALVLGVDLGTNRVDFGHADPRCNEIVFDYVQPLRGVGQWLAESLR